MPDVARESTRWVGVPGWRDPRIPFALIVTSLAAIGVIWLDFNRSPLQILAIVASGCALDMLLHWLLNGRTLLVPLSSYLSSISIALLLNFPHGSLLFLIPVFFTIASKYVFTLNGSHVFNPSLFGVVATLVGFGHLITVAPPYQWGGTALISVYMVIAAITLFITRVNREWLVGSFLVFYGLETLARAAIFQDHISPTTLVVSSMTTPPFFLFTFFMITDPKTSPDSRRGQILLASAVACADLAWHLTLSLYTLYYAAFTVAIVRFAWGHVTSVRSEGARGWLRTRLVSRRQLHTAAVVVVLATPLIALFTMVISPRITVRDPGFRLEEVSAARSGVQIDLDASILSAVSPPVRNVAKWALQMGSSISTPDLDGDGLPEIAVTNVYGVPRDRIAVFHNLGNMRFMRLKLPALDRFATAPRDVGIPTSTVWFDYDNDGRLDVLVTSYMGAIRLLHNETNSGGEIALRDVSSAAGVDAYASSFAANAFDYDRDGDLDVMVAMFTNLQLTAYDPPRRFNLFDLPAREHRGDRRMLRFLQNSFINADNGSTNLVLENRGDGTFRRRDGRELGMPQTHWSIAVGTPDLNDDGFPDLYVANDNGPDDVYLNRRRANSSARTFTRINTGRFKRLGNDTYKGMNVSVADFDRNGHQDVYVSNMHEPLVTEGSMLWMNRGSDDRGVPDLTDDAGWRGVLNEERFGWGAGAGDLNNDGLVDIVQVNGNIGDRFDHRKLGGVWSLGGERCPNFQYVNQKLMQTDNDAIAYADNWSDIRGMCSYPNELRRVYLNRGVGRSPMFVDAARQVGLTRRASSRGVALSDLDGDGNLDAAIANIDEPPVIYRSRPSKTGRRRPWVGIKLVGDGKTCARDAFGSRVELESPRDRPIIVETHAVNGFAAQNDGVIHMGVGSNTGASVAATVRWCGGDDRTYRLATGKVTILHQ